MIAELYAKPMTEVELVTRTVLSNEPDIALDEASPTLIIAGVYQVGGSTNGRQRQGFPEMQSMTLTPSTL
jgi:hypothetical protein